MVAVTTTPDALPQHAVAPPTLRAALAPLRDRACIPGWPHAAGAVVHLALVVACALASASGQHLLTIACWPILTWMHHAALARLHEAVHSMLLRSRIGNELCGIAIGTISLTPMSVYRYVHARHHAHLGDTDDPEFWPYNLPGASRARRLAYATAELLIGFVLTPALYSLRTARAWRRHAESTRRRLLLEWLLMAGFWSATLAVVYVAQAWQLFFVAVLAPGWLTGLMQTVRKFTEHLGLAGDSIPTTTRTVVYQGRLGCLLSRTQLHVEHHGTHHRWPRIPYANLPAATAIVESHGVAGLRYRTHFAATWAAFRHLANPRVGRQWVAAGRGAGMEIAESLTRAGAASPSRCGHARSRTSPVHAP